MKLLQTSGLTRSCVQMASNGAWEEAISVADCTVEWIEKSGENIAIEAVYTDHSSELAGFVGFRKTMPDPVERTVFWQAIISATFSCEHDTPSAQVSFWLKVLNLPPILSTPPQFSELGVFNLWQSMGTIRHSSDKFQLSKIQNAPSWLLDGADAPICMETVWDIGDGFWVASNVSTKTARRYYLHTSFVA